MKLTTIKQLKELLDDYQLKTGITSVIINKSADVIEEDHSDWFCKKHYCNNQKACQEEHQLVLNESLRWGGLFMHLCHNDMVIWGSPICENEQIRGGILSGFVAFKELKTDLESYKEIADPTKKLTLFSHDTLNQLSQQLLTLLKENGVLDTAYLKEIEDKVQIQRVIAENIIDKKHKGEDKINQVYQKQDRLINSIRLCETDKIRSHLNEVLAEIYLEAINDINLLKFRMLELFVLISRAMLDVGGEASEFYQLTSQYVKNTDNLNEIFSFSHWLTGVLNDFITRVIENRKKLGRIQRAIDYIKQNLHQKISISDVAAQVAISESRFSHLFRQEVGQTFSVYLNRLRIEKAKELMNTKEYDIAEIAMSLNFFDQSYFTKVFKRYIGVTPSQYSKQQNNTKQ